MILIPFWLVQSPEIFQPDIFEKYGAYSIAALAIIVLFWGMKMQNERDLKRDEQRAQRDKQMAEKDAASLEALNSIVLSLGEMNSKQESMRVLIEERLPR